MEIVEGSPPYDAAEIISLMATRVICDVLAGPGAIGQSS
jgi:agmatinase